jgi:hypothetical protein
MSHDASFHLLSECDTTLTAPVPKSSIALSNIELYIVDDPLESWLQEISPLWKEELEEKLASDEWVSRVGQTVSGRETRDYFYDSKRWVDRVKNHKDRLRYLIHGSYSLDSPPALLRLTLGSCQIDCDVGNIVKSSEIVSRFTSEVDLMSIDIMFLLQAAVSMSMSASEIQVNIRGQAEPIAHISDVLMAGEFAMLLPETREPFNFPFPIPTVMSLPKVYADMKCHCSGVTSSFRPTIMYGMQEAAAFANRLLPQSSLPSKKTWKKMR